MKLVNAKSASLICKDVGCRPSYYNEFVQTTQGPLKDTHSTNEPSNLASQGSFANREDRIGREPRYGGLP